MVVIDIIQNRMEETLNEQAFDAALDAACVRHVCNEVCRILYLSEQENYSQSTGFTLHVPDWTVEALTHKCVSLQWLLDMAEKVKETLRCQWIQ